MQAVEPEEAHHAGVSSEEETRRLREEVEKLRAALQASGVASQALREADAAHQDALMQFVTEHTAP
jgi:hypothetical protein